MTYAEKRACAEVLEKVTSYQLGASVRIHVKPDPDPKRAANQQAAYGLAKLEERLR